MEVVSARYMDNDNLTIIKNENGLFMAPPKMDSNTMPEVKFVNEGDVIQNEDHNNKESTATTPRTN